MKQWIATLVLLTIATAVRAADRPNIIVMLADDMGYSDINCYGGEIDTPNINALAAGGVKLNEFYNTSRCCPTRACLMTGVYPHQAGVGHMTWVDTKFPGYRGKLSHSTPTIAEVLRSAGYSTYMSGKWHLTIDDKPDKSKDDWPRQRGFDRYYGIIKGSGSYYDPAMLVRDNQPITPRSDSEYKSDHYYFTDAIADQAIRYIGEHEDGADKEKPFFLYVAFTSPHWPLQAPEETIAKYKGKYDGGYESIREARFDRMKQLGVIDKDADLSSAPEPWSEVKNKKWESRCMEVYAAQLDRMDQNVGRIMATLKDKSLLDNTLVMFLSDNGGCDEDTGRKAMPKRDAAAATQPRPVDEPQLQSNGPYTLDGIPVRTGPKVMPGSAETFVAYGQNWANVSNTPFRMYKHYVHEGGISTPFIASWAGHIKPTDGYNPTPTHLVDIMATAVELSGAQFPDAVAGEKTTPLQGVSLIPLLTGGSLQRPSPIFFEHEGNRAVRDGQWKIVARGENGRWELYDIDTDRSELNDLATQHPDRVKSMSDAWQKWAAASQVFPLLPQDKQDKKERGKAE